MFKLKFSIPLKFRLPLIVLAFIGCFIASILMTLPFITAAKSAKMQLNTTNSRIKNIERQLKIESAKIKKIKKNHEEEQQTVASLTTSLDALLWKDGLEAKYYLYSVSQMLKITIINEGKDIEIKEKNYDISLLPVEVNGNFTSIAQLFYLLENSEKFLYIANKSINLKRLDNGTVTATFMMSAYTKQEVK